jgi:hypothetical protein
VSKGEKSMLMSWRTRVDRGPARNVYDAVLLLGVIGRVKGAIDWLIGRAGEDDGGARGPDGTFSATFFPEIQLSYQWRDNFPGRINS